MPARLAQQALRQRLPVGRGQIAQPRGPHAGVRYLGLEGSLFDDQTTTPAARAYRVGRIASFTEPVT